MAAPIELLKSFVDGQGAGAGTYAGYATDLDSNFTTLETQFNVLAAEVRAFGGNNAVLSLDLALSSSPAVSEGFVGTDSFAPVSFLAGNTQVQVPAGVAMTAASGRVENTTGNTFTGTGASGSRFLALQANGLITQETAAGQGILDLYSVNWNGASFDVGTLARLPTSGDVIVEADDFQNTRIQEDISQGSDAAIPAFTYDRIQFRLDDVVRVLAGVGAGGVATSSHVGLGSGSADQADLNPIAIGGAATVPGMVVGNPSSGYDPTTGLFGDFATNALGVVVEATTLVSFLESTVNEPQARFRNGTDLANPPVAFVDSDNGLGFVSADEWRLIAGGVEVARVIESSGNPILGLASGTAANPGTAFEQSRTTGIHRPGADRFGISISGAAAFELDASGALDLPTNPRVRTTRNGQSLTEGALTNVGFDAEAFDVGGWHDNVTNNDRHTVPADGDGTYAIHCTATFDESTGGTSSNLGRRRIQITVNGSAVDLAGTHVDAVGSPDDTQLVASDAVSLSAGDIVRVQVEFDAGNANTMDVDAQVVIHKIA